jgi:hypothetical protein
MSRPLDRQTIGPMEPVMGPIPAEMSPNLPVFGNSARALVCADLQGRQAKSGWVRSFFTRESSLGFSTLHRCQERRLRRSDCLRRDQPLASVGRDEHDGVAVIERTCDLATGVCRVRVHEGGTLGVGLAAIDRLLDRMVHRPCRGRLCGFHVARHPSIISP